MIYFDENGEFRRGRGKGEIVARDFVHGSPICHAPCMARTEAFKSVGGYSVDDRLLRVEDYHLWFKLFSTGHKLFMMNECLYKMRDDRNAKSRRKWIGRRNAFLLMNKGFRMINLLIYGAKFFPKFPKYNTCRNRDIERMLGPPLRDLQTLITHIYHLLVYPFHLISKYQSISLAILHLQILQRSGVLGLLHTYKVATVEQRLYGLFLYVLDHFHGLQ